MCFLRTDWNSHYLSVEGGLTWRLNGIYFVFLCRICGPTLAQIPSCISSLVQQYSSQHFISKLIIKWKPHIFPPLRSVWQYLGLHFSLIMYLHFYQPHSPRWSPGSSVSKIFSFLYPLKMSPVFLTSSLTMENRKLSSSFSLLRLPVDLLFRLNSLLVFFKVSIGIRYVGEGSYYLLPVYVRMVTSSTENRETNKVIILYYFIVHWWWILMYSLD